MAVRDAARMPGAARIHRGLRPWLEGVCRAEIQPIAAGGNQSQKRNSGHRSGSPGSFVTAEAEGASAPHEPAVDIERRAVDAAAGPGREKGDHGRDFVG